MTAEVALLNKHAVALAADSAVTVSGMRGNKIYNAANKLFALSKYEPVGIMVYGNAEYMGVPWETIIKIYRAELGHTWFSTLGEYYDSFVAFLGSNDELFGPSVQKEYVKEVTRATFLQILQEVRGRVDALIKSKPAEGADESDVNAIVDATVIEFHQEFSSAEFAEGFDAEHEQVVRNEYGELIASVAADIFQRLPLNDAQRGLLLETIVFGLTRRRYPTGTSGVVIAGFGAKQHFPHLRSCIVQARTAGRLKHQKHESADVAEDGASIVPFAQIDAVKLFVEGIDPTHATHATRLVRRALDGLRDDILSTLSLTEDNKAQALEAWDKAISERLREFSDAARASRAKNYISPLLDVIAVLPKDELAAIAEALVNITSLRRKMSLQEETVGGPIDVLVISKGDGLIWLKRKHYFDAALNPHFLRNYFRVQEGDQHEA